MGNNSPPILQTFLIAMLRHHKFPARESTQVLLHLGEEVKELERAIRGKKPKEAIAGEIADVVWHLMRLCDIEGIDLNAIVLEKIVRDEARTPTHFSLPPKSSEDFNGGGK